MPSLLDLLLATVIASGAHTLGHIEEGNRQNVDVTVNLRELTESWDTIDKGKNLRIHGGGFRSQDALAKLADSKKIGSSIRLANGLYKLGYLSNIHGRLGTKGLGDTKSIDKATGNKIASYSVLLSALSDLHKAKNPNTNLGLEFWQTEKGTPGIKLINKW